MELGPERRYVVERMLGEGTFGRVLACSDKLSKETVAVKVVKGIKRYCEHAEAEAEVLSEILRKDSERKGQCVDMLDTFLHDGVNFCIVFEALDTSVRDFLKANDSRGLLLANIREMAWQLLETLAFLHTIGVTHTDLKCRNVMLRDGSSFDVVPHPRDGGNGEVVTTRRLRNCHIVLIDFGGAVFPEERHLGRIGTRQFRAPEVVLGLPWDETSDLFSAGCIIAMLYLGERPFSVHEDMEHLAMMEKVLGGELPRAMLSRAAQERLLPDGVHCARGRLLWPQKAPDASAVERVRDIPLLRDRVCARHHIFYDSLLHGLLQPDPRKRLAASAALQCGFFKQYDVAE